MTFSYLEYLNGAKMTDDEFWEYMGDLHKAQAAALALRLRLNAMFRSEFAQYPLKLWVRLLLENEVHLLEFSLRDGPEDETWEATMIGFDKTDEALRFELDRLCGSALRMLTPKREFDPPSHPDDGKST